MQSLLAATEWSLGAFPLLCFPHSVGGAGDWAGDHQGWECRGPARWAKVVMDPSP